MRILHTSDWHLGKSLENISRIEEQREFINFLCEKVEEEQIDLVLVAGDVYDTYNPSSAAEELFYEAIDRLSDKGNRAVIVIAGNHDNPERLCASSPLAYKNGIILLGYPKSDVAEFKNNSSHVKIEGSGPGWFEISIPSCDNNAVILALPYPSEARLEEVLSVRADEEVLRKAYSDKIEILLKNYSQNFRQDTVNIVVAHMFLKGGRESESERVLQVGGAMTVDASSLPKDAHYVALGHLHRPQEIKKSPCPTFYSGSPLAYSFSEAEHAKAVYIVDVVPGNETIIEPLYLNCGKPLRRWFASEGIDQVISWCEEGRDENAWVDIEVETERIITSDEQKIIRQLHPGIINIRPKMKTIEFDIENYKDREGMKIDELFKEYYKYKLGSDIPDEVMRTFIEILNDEEESKETLEL